MIRQFQSREFLTLPIAGGIAASVDFGCLIPCRRWKGVSPAVILAYVIRMATTFAL